ncbi:MAG: pyridoxal phosphate-dependent aminotransferase [Acidobacteria bacterium]|nr:pyridoxal phosphate-dependent aminotransferase [Acidobacteriota bacterium]
MKRLYSSRLPWHTPANRLALLREQHAGYLDLTVSNPTHAGLHYPADLLDALRDPRMLTYEPAAAGLRLAREAVSAYYARRGAQVDPERILLTASTSEAYSYLFKLFCDPGDEVLVPRPSYPLFEFLANLDAVQVAHYSMFYDGHWTIDQLPVTQRSRAIIAVSPNNPTGSLADLDRLRAPGLPLIVDEVFADYAPRAAMVEDAFYLNGLSKIAGLPQMKLGWIVYPEQHRDALELIADTYLSVSAPVQYASLQWLPQADALQEQIRERCRVNEAWLRARLRGTALTPLRIDGGWTIPVEIPQLRGEEDVVCSLLEEHQVLVQPGYFYDFPREAYIVISLLTRPDILEEGVRRIVDTIG